MSFKKLLALCALACAAQSHAATTVEFLMPDGNVGTNDVIEVWLRISTDTGFNFDASDPDGDNSYGGALDPADLPSDGFSPEANMGDGGFVEFDSIEFVGASISASCTGSFVIDSNGDCGLGGMGTENYTFSFGNGSDWAPGGQLSLAPGETMDFLYGTFIPVTGGAAPGTYDYFSASIGIFFFGAGFDDFGEEVSVSAFRSLAITCEAGDTSCDFTRTVGAQVPVPAAVWLFASAFLGLVGTRRRTE